MKDQDTLLDLQTTDSFRLYLDEVGRHPLLTKDDEIELSQAFEAGQAAQTVLRDLPAGHPDRQGLEAEAARADADSIDAALTARERLDEAESPTDGRRFTRA